MQGEQATMRVCRCGKKLSSLNKDTICFACQAAETKRKLDAIPDRPLVPRPAPMCSRGCGQRTHRGNCPAQKIKPVAPPPPSPNPERKLKLDTLKSKPIRIDEIPDPQPVMRKQPGRLGEIWEKLETNEPGMAEAVENRDNEHLNRTLQHTERKAAKLGRKLNYKRNGTTLYLWLDPKEAA